jgi:DNA-binding transcriptional LysR family regulator
MDAPVPRDELTSLATFAVVADERSFTKAARKLGLSRSAISHSILTLEERLGVRLLARTTRSVAPTEAGQDLLAHVRPALNDIQASLAELGHRRAKPGGTIRLIAPPMAVSMVVWPRLAKFARDYPEVVLDVTTEGDSRPDLVAGRFDAGIHLGEFVQRDMVAVKITGQQRAAIVVAPAYFDSHPKPKTPTAASTTVWAPPDLRTDGSSRSAASRSLSRYRGLPSSLTRRSLSAPRSTAWGWRTCSRRTWPGILRGVSSCECSRTGAPPSTATSFTTRAGATSRQRFRHWLRASESDRAGVRLGRLVRHSTNSPR